MNTIKSTNTRVGKFRCTTEFLEDIIKQGKTDMLFSSFTPLKIDENSDTHVLTYYGLHPDFDSHYISDIPLDFSNQEHLDSIAEYDVKFNKVDGGEPTRTKWTKLVESNDNVDEDVEQSESINSILQKLVDMLSKEGGSLRGGRYGSPVVMGIVL